MKELFEQLMPVLPFLPVVFDGEKEKELVLLLARTVTESPRYRYGISSLKMAPNGSTPRRTEYARRYASQY